MKLFREKVTPTLASSNLNILTVENFEEIFFDVYELEINGEKQIAEKIGEHKGAPVISIPVEHNGRTFDAPFVLQQGAFDVIFFDNDSSVPTICMEEYIKPVPFDYKDGDQELEEIIFDRKDAILQEIANAREAAAAYAEKLKALKLEESDKSIELKKKAFEKEIEGFKKDLLDEFLSLVEGVKGEVHSLNEHERKKLVKFITRSVTSVSNDLERSIADNNVLLEKSLSDKLNEMATNVLSGVLLAEIVGKAEKSANVLNERFELAVHSLNKLIDEREQKIHEDLRGSIMTLESANVDLHNAINKGSNRALSRLGNVKTSLETSIAGATADLTSKISIAEDRIRQYYDEKLILLENSVNDVTDENRNHYITLINESRESLLDEIGKIKVDVPNIIIQEKNGFDKKIDLKGIKNELEKIIGQRFSSEITALKRLIEMSSGGGSVATQYANGGVINGNLVITGTISASNYAGVSGGGGGPSTDTLHDVVVRGNITPLGISVASLSANSINLNLSPTLGSFTEGQIFYDDKWKTVAAYIENDVTMQIGQEDLNYVYNNSSDAIFDGQAVYVTGSGGDGINVITDTIALAKADSTSTSTTVGVATCHIPIGAYGFVTSRGKINNFDTTTLGVEGNLLYLSPLSAGAITPTIPESPYPRIVVGRLLINDALSGRISIYPKQVPDATVSVLASVSVNQYMVQTISTDDPTYRVLTYTNTLTSLNRSVTVAANPALSATILGDQFLYPVGIGVTQIPSGTWDFDIPAYVSNANQVTRFKMEIHMYHVDTSTTKLFEVFSGDINDSVLANHKFSYSSPDYTVLATDRLMVRLYGTTTRSGGTTLHYVIGDGNGAFLTTPLQLRHTLLRGFNEDPSVQHLNATEAIAVRSLVTGNVTGNLTVSGTVSANNLIYNGGNTTTGPLSVGTLTGQNLALVTNGTTRMTVTSGGLWTPESGTMTINGALSTSGNVNIGATALVSSAGSSFVITPVAGTNLGISPTQFYAQHGGSTVFGTTNATINGASTVNAGIFGWSDFAGNHATNRLKANISMLSDGILQIGTNAKNANGSLVVSNLSATGTATLSTVQATKIGINTAPSTYTLDVNGSSNITGDASFLGNLTGTHLQNVGVNDSPQFKTLSAISGSLSASNPNQFNQTWNSLSTFEALTVNVTDLSGANAASTLMDLKVGGVSKFKVSKAGTVIAGSISLPYKEISTNYSILSTDYTIVATAPSTITLPSCIGNTGRILNIKNMDGRVVMLSAFGSELIDFSNTVIIDKPVTITIQARLSGGFIIL